MNKVYFMNNGDFDVRAMLTMGVSAKSDDAIGFFGTGFKYAIAITLRLGGSIKVCTLSGVYEFTARKETIRDKEFSIVYMNDREAGFTTHLGANWEPWMAYRELYCNAKDEGGLIDTQANQDFDTIIEVECPDIAKAHHQASDYFLASNPVSKSTKAEIHDARKPFIYYRGIAVRNAYDQMMFTYNVTRPVTLTEDRTAKYEHEVQWAIQDAIQNCEDRAMLRKCLRSGEHAEARMAYDKDWGTSKAFLEVCGELMNSDAGLCEGARVLAEEMQSQSGDWPEFAPNKVQSMMLDRAKSFLFKLDIDVDRFPVKLVRGLGDGVMGRAHDGVIYLSEMPFNMGTKQVASTLMEEWVHNKYGVKDFDRNMQNWLFDKILSLGEIINQEPI